MRLAAMGVVGGSLVLAACAGAKVDAPRVVPPLYAMDARDARPTSAPAAPVAADAQPEPPTLPAPPRRPRDPHELVQMRFRLTQADGKLVTAPSVTTFAGEAVHVSLIAQKAFIQDFDVEVQEGGVIADPIVGMLVEGLEIDVLAEEVPGRADEIAFAFRVGTAAVLDPTPLRELRPLPFPAQPVTIEVPKLEHVEVVGARRVRAGVETEIARLPGPQGDVVLLGSLSRIHVADLDSLLLDPLPRDDAPDDAHTDLRRLARTAATGPAAQRLRADAIRSRGEVVGSIGATTILAPGVRLERSLTESYVQGFEARSGAADPTIATHQSGLWLDVAPDGDFKVRWVVTRFGRRAVEVRPGFTIDTEFPESVQRTAKYALGADDGGLGRAIHGDSRVHVSFEPLP